MEADRGEDLGVVVAIAPEDSPLSMSIYAASALSMRMTDSDFSKKILRIASMQERADLPFKRQQEMILLEVCRDRARDSYALPITLLDAEYQFDRNKLVLHYSASRYAHANTTLQCTFPHSSTTSSKRSPPAHLLHATQAHRLPRIRERPLCRLQDKNLDGTSLFELELRS